MMAGEEDNKAIEEPVAATGAATEEPAAAKPAAVKKAAKKPAAKKPAAKKPAAKKKAAKKPAAKKAAKKPAAKKAEGGAAKRSGRAKKQGKVLRIRLRSFDHRQLDAAADIIVRTAKHSGADVRGPIPLPIGRTRYDLLRSPHVDKDSREQIEIRTYHRLVDIHSPTQKTVESFNELQIPDGVMFNMKEMQ